MTGNNEENVKRVDIDINLNLEDGIDPKKVTEYFEKLFIIGERLGVLLHDEKLTVAEALFVIYSLEKGALSTMDVGISDDMTRILLEDNNTKMNIIVDTIIKHKIAKDDTNSIKTSEVKLTDIDLS